MAKKTKGASIIYWILLVVLVAGLGGFGVQNFGGAVESVEEWLVENSHENLVREEERGATGPSPQGRRPADSPGVA